MARSAHRPRRHRRLLLAASLVATLVGADPDVARAACTDESVTTTAELVAAVAAANACSGAQTITVLPPRTTYDAVEIVVTDDLALIGDRPNTDLGGAGNRGSSTPSVMITVQGAALTLQDLRLTHEVEGPLGFVVGTDAELGLNRVALVGQQSFWSGNGFGIDGFRTDLVIAGSTFSDVDGTLIDVEQGSLDVSGLTGTDVRGAGIVVRNAPATIDGLDIERFGLGGGPVSGVDVTDVPSAVVENTRIVDGPKGIDIADSVGALIEWTTVGDIGGVGESAGIVADSTSFGTKVRESTITNASIGIDTATDTTIENVDVTDNTSAGIVRRGGQAEMVQTLVERNALDCQIVAGTIVDAGGNSDEDDTCGFDVSEITVEFFVEFARIASEGQDFGAHFDFPGAAHSRSDPVKPFDVDDGWPFADAGQCSGELSDWFEFRRPTCSGAFEVSPLGGSMPIEHIGGLPIWSGDCRNGVGGPVVDYTVGRSSQCALTMVTTENEDPDGAAVHITERWIGDPTVAVTPAVELDPVGPLPPTAAGGYAPFPSEPCPLDPAIGVQASFDACYDPLADCVANDAGCEGFFGLPIEAAVDVDVVVENVAGWATFFGGDCDETGRIAAVAEYTLHRCDLVHVQNAAGNGVIVDWVIDGGVDLFGPLGPSNSIDVEATFAVGGTDVAWERSVDALPPQDQPDLDCAAPEFVTGEFPATCRSIADLPAGDYDLAVENDFSGTWDATRGGDCVGGSITVPAAGYAICRIDLTALAPAFDLDPTPREVAEGTGPTPTPIDIELSFDTPTPAGYTLLVTTLQEAAYQELIGDLAAPWYTSGSSDLAPVAEVQAVPTGSTSYTVTVEAVADATEELDEGFILQIEEADTTRRVRLPITLLNDDQQPVIDQVDVDFDDGASPLANHFTLDESGATAVSYEWTLQPSGQTWTTTVPALDVMMVDVGTNTMTVVSTNADGADSAPASTTVEVEPTTLQLTSPILVEGDTFSGPEGAQLRVAGVLERAVELDVRVTATSTSTSTTEVPQISTGCFGSIDLATTDNEVRINSPFEDLPIVTCPDDDPEREATVLVELIEPETDTVIVAHDVTLADDDRYELDPIVIREGGYGGDLYESIPTTAPVDYETPPWYSAAPQRYDLQGGDPLPRPCSPGDFAPGANFGLRRTGDIVVAASIVDPPLGVDVVACGDAQQEDTVELILTVTAPDGSIDRTTVTILDDDATPVFDTSSRFVNEPAATTNGTISVPVASQPFLRQVAFAWSPLPGGAIPGPCVPGTPPDFVPSADPLYMIPAGATSIDVPLLLCGDSLTDVDGDVRLSIARVPTSLAEVLAPVIIDVLTVTIIDAGTPTIVAGPVSVVEGDDGTKSAVVTIAAGSGGTSAATVNYVTDVGSAPTDERASVGTDYDFTQGTLPGQPSPWTRTVTIPILGDEVEEGDEQFVLELSSPDALVVTPTVEITIVDDDEITVSVGNATVDEGDDAFVAISLSNPSNRPVTVEWETRDRSAAKNSDYVASGRTETFAAGSTSRVVSIDTLSDDDDEDDETFRVFAATAHNFPSSDEGTVTIRDATDGDGVPPFIDQVDEIEVFIPVDAPRQPSVRLPIGAIDDLDGPVPVSCTPASDSQFPIGRTPVTCNASDAAGNVATVSFEVVVAERSGIFVLPRDRATGQPVASARPLDPGEEISVDATGFLPGEAVVIEFRSDPVMLAQLDADADGTVTAVVEVPAGIEPGEHTVAIVPVDTDAGDRTVLVPVELAGGAVWTPLPPARVVDTRATGETIDDVDEAGGTIAGDSQIRIRMGGRAGVPDDAAGVVANITAIRPTDTGFLTAHPCLDDLPLAASLNFSAGVNLGNEVIIGLDEGDLCIYSSADTDLTVDVVGYVPRLSATKPVAPARYLDTRVTGRTLDTESAGEGAPGAGERVAVRIGGRGEVPLDAAAVVMYVTAIRPTSVGFVTVWDCSAERPLASSLNHIAGVNRGNEIVATPSATGEVCLFTSDDVDVTVDVVAFVPAAANFVPLDEPSRLLDTRGAATTVDGRSAGAGSLPDGGQLTLEVAGRAGIDPAATTVTMNVTAISPSGIGFISAFACDVERPNAASLNFVAGVNGGNEIVASLDDDGQVCLYTSTATHVSVDVTGSTTPTSFA